MTVGQRFESDERLKALSEQLEGAFVIFSGFARDTARFSAGEIAGRTSSQCLQAVEKGDLARER